MVGNSFLCSQVSVGKPRMGILGHPPRISIPHPAVRFRPPIVCIHPFKRLLIDRIDRFRCAATLFCGTQNSVFRGVTSPAFQTLGELAQGAAHRRESTAYVVDWKCWHCGRQFQTETMLQDATRSGT
jgi:hypothetical protein